MRRRRNKNYPLLNQVKWVLVAHRLPLKTFYPKDKLIKPSQTMANSQLLIRCKQDLQGVWLQWKAGKPTNQRRTVSRIESAQRHRPKTTQAICRFSLAEVQDTPPASLNHSKQLLLKTRKLTSHNSRSRILLFLPSKEEMFKCQNLQWEAQLSLVMITPQWTQFKRALWSRVSK